MRDFTNQYEAKIRVNGNSVNEYQHEGNTYIEGRAGSRYELVFQNYTHERLLVVPSVDGLSVFTGQPASINSDGYVVNANQVLNIPGWTLDKNNVAEFVFGDVRDSYSRKSNQGDSNVGVIGFLVFREKYIPPIFQIHSGVVVNPIHTYQPWTSTSAGWTWPETNDITYDSWNGSISASNNMTSSTAGNNSAQISAPNQMVQQEVGTVFGNQTQFNTTETTFQKRDANYPDALISIYYDSIRGLEKRGIILRNNKPTPNPFSGTKQWCIPPSDWRN